VVKLLPHFVLYLADICFVPVTILFGYCHGLIKFYAFLTLYVVSPRNVVLFNIILTILDYLGQSRGEQQREVGDIVPGRSISSCLVCGGLGGDKVLGCGVQGEDDGGLDAWENTIKENVAHHQRRMSKCFSVKFRDSSRNVWIILYKACFVLIYIPASPHTSFSASLSRLAPLLHEEVLF
jgi:hypothetical protein